jgi:hypothetical protein
LLSFPLFALTLSIRQNILLPLLIFVENLWVF